MDHQYQASPPVGVISVCLSAPLSIQECQHYIDQLHAIVVQVGILPVKYNQLYYKVQETWAYYRATQPNGYRAELDLKLAEILDCMTLA